MLPPTPSTGASERDREAPSPPHLKDRARTLSILRNFTEYPSKQKVTVGCGRAVLRRNAVRIRNFFTIPKSLEPQSKIAIVWLFIACCSFLYNAWMVPMRTIFSEYQTADNLLMWLLLDYLCDAIYLIDIVIFKVRLQFFKNGSWVTKPVDIRNNYFKSSRFLVDVISLLPLDFFYFLFGPISIFRFTRLFKIGVFWEFFNRLDAVISNPILPRLSKAIFYMSYTIHINALIYYGFSKYEGVGSNEWVFQGQGNAYVRCYYFAIKTATSIGKNPKPVNVYEQALMTVCWLSGVFVFAVLIGQVKDIVLSATKNIDDYRRIEDQTITYLVRFNVPEPTINKVRMWFNHTWQKLKTLDEIECLKVLPTKLQMDLARNVHIATLSKIQLFHDCEENFLLDLLLLLKPTIYLPGDYICRKGEVGKEMYIVKNGKVQVVSEDGGTVFATLNEGSVFGEISLLGIAGTNRRTADVRSLGYSNLFILRKEDLEVTIKNYPNAQKVLEKKAAQMIRKTKMREKTPSTSPIIGKKRKKSPKMLHAVAKLASQWSLSSSLKASAKKLESRSSIGQSKISSPNEATHHRELQRKASMDEPFSDEDEMLFIQSDGQKPRLFFENTSSSSSLHSTLPEIQSFQSAFGYIENNVYSLEDEVGETYIDIVDETCENFTKWMKKYEKPVQTVEAIENKFVTYIPEEERKVISLSKQEEKLPLTAALDGRNSVRSNRSSISYSRSRCGSAHLSDRDKIPKLEGTNQNDFWDQCNNCATNFVEEENDERTGIMNMNDLNLGYDLSELLSSDEDGDFNLNMDRVPLDLDLSSDSTLHNC